ncbi:MAG: hypothetical protein WD334_07060, partial [Chitinophagales bacterium]
KKEVPQDDANLLEGKFQVVKYALDDNGNYVKVNSVGWEPENVALEQAWDEIGARVKEAHDAVKAGEKSPLYYYMIKNLMDPGLLSDYMGIAKWRVKRHLKPKVFAGLKASTHEKYARIFNISVKELLNIQE